MRNASDIFENENENENENKIVSENEIVDGTSKKNVYPDENENDSVGPVWGSYMHYLDFYGISQKKSNILEQMKVMAFDASGTMSLQKRIALVVQPVHRCFWEKSDVNLFCEKRNGPYTGFEA